jgi:hypothetical protein
MISNSTKLLVHTPIYMRIGVSFAGGKAFFSAASVAAEGAAFAPYSTFSAACKAVPFVKKNFPA